MTARYHHGDLRQALLQAADELIREEGCDKLSLRRLSERVGVSRMAPYHHFADKQALLCELAREGFLALDTLIQQCPRPSITSATISSPTTTQHTALATLVHAYIDFAISHPERYELMFGRVLWKHGAVTEELRTDAYNAFRHYADCIGVLIAHLQPSADTPPAPQDQVAPQPQAARHGLRLAQATWATLHGLCRLQIDGIYIDQQDMRAVSETAVNMILNGLGANS